VQERVQSEPPVDVRATRSSPARLAILGLLLESPAHPYEVALRFGQRMGQTWGIHRGQVYQAVYGLERDGLVERVDGDDEDEARTVFRATERGREVFDSWLQSDAGGPAPVRDALLIRLAFLSREHVLNLRDLVARREHAIVGRLWHYREVGRVLEEWPQQNDEEAVGLELILDRTLAALHTELRWLEKVRVALTSLESANTKDGGTDDTAAT
jgi:DNA-binding PadR family transcriptional regulator